MRLNIIILVLIFQGLFVFGQRNCKLIDSLTNKPVHFAKISFNNKRGTFTNDNGSFKLDIDINSLKIYAEGYYPKSFNVKNQNDTLYKVAKMTTERNILDSKLNYVNSSKNEGYWHDNYLKCMQPDMEKEIAIFIPNNNLNNTSELSCLLFPIKTSTIVVENNIITNREEKQPFKTIIKIKFYKNNNDLPGELLYNENTIIKVDEKSSNFITIKFDKGQIILPEKGLFVAFEFLGVSLKKDELFEPFDNHIYSNNTVAMPKRVNPPIPITGNLKHDWTFIKSNFDNDSKWQSFSNYFSNYSLLKGYDNLNIGIGYEINIYK